MGCNNTASSDNASTILERALASGHPTIAEFGRGVCIPCKTMKPILEDIAVEYKGELNVVIVEVDDNIDLTRKFGIMTIPTQIFFGSNGTEVFRHVGFYPQENIITQLGVMGID
ncbi:MAG: thioredoxin family protein [Dehalococcoidales bacterium]|nr:thioredoxin family protein [Dehalococcoidales bacterium]